MNNNAVIALVKTLWGWLCQSFPDLVKNSVAWIFVAVGHAVSDINLSRAALITSIIYSVVNVWLAIERRGKHAKEED